jgi:hypothetical protein
MLWEKVEGNNLEVYMDGACTNGEMATWVIAIPISILDSVVILR